MGFWGFGVLGFWGVFIHFLGVEFGIKKSCLCKWNFKYQVWYLAVPSCTHCFALHWAGLSTFVLSELLRYLPLSGLIWGTHLSCTYIWYYQEHYSKQTAGLIYKSLVQRSPDFRSWDIWDLRSGDLIKSGNRQHANVGNRGRKFGRN